MYLKNILKVTKCLIYILQMHVILNVNIVSCYLERNWKMN